MHIFGAADFPLFCSNSAQKCLILPAECSPQKSLFLLKILPAEFIQAKTRLFGGVSLNIWCFELVMLIPPKGKQCEILNQELGKVVRNG